MDDMVVGLSLDDWEDLVWKLCGDLVHSECHLVDVNNSNFEASWGVNIVTSGYVR